MKTRSIIIFILLLLADCANAQRANVYRDSVEVFFRQGEHVLDSSMCDNGVRLAQFAERLSQMAQDSSLHVYKVAIMASASPEGPYALNQKLSQHRTASIHSYMQERLSVTDETFVLKAVGSDWGGLVRLLRTSGMPHRDEALRIIEETDILPAAEADKVRKERFQHLHGGQTWNVMTARLFPALRKSTIYVTYEGTPYEEMAQVGDTITVRGALDPQDPDRAPEVSESAADDAAHRVFAPEKPDARRNLYIGLRTNLLYDVALIPNLGIDIYLGHGLSLATAWNYAWWFNNPKHYYWQTYGGDMELRYWFGQAAQRKPLTGWHTGVYGQIITWDVELGGRGVQAAKWNYGGGIALGFSLPVAKRLNIDFNLGVGYLGGQYEKYIPYGDYYPWQSTHKLIYYGPTKAEISLVWLIGHGNHNQK